MKRPVVPLDGYLLEPHGQLYDAPAAFEPAPELKDWIVSTFIADDGPLCNTEHSHLLEAEIRCLWTNVEYKKGQTSLVMATAEIPRPPQGISAWGRGRWEAQMLGWFGFLPDFLLTFYAPEWSNLNDRQACRLVEHELFHCAQALDEFGNPAFKDSDGSPKWRIRPHDWEGFEGEVSRYGLDGQSHDTLSRILAAAKGKPEVEAASIAAACGACRKAT